MQQRIDSPKRSHEVVSPHATDSCVKTGDEETLSCKQLRSLSPRPRLQVDENLTCLRSMSSERHVESFQTFTESKALPVWLMKR